MKICIVFFSYGTWGGGERLVHELAWHLAERKETVTIVLNDEVRPYFTDIPQVSLVNVGLLYPHKARARRHVLWRLCYMPYDTVRRVLYRRRARNKLTRYLSDSSVDVVHPVLEHSVALVADLVSGGKVPRIPMVTFIWGEPHLRGIEPVNRGFPLFRNQDAKRFREGLLKMDRVMATSVFMVRAWEKQGVYLGDRAIVILGGNRIDEIRSYQGKGQKREGEFSLLFPGGARWIKGGDIVLEGLPKVKEAIPNVHLYIALDVPEDHVLRTMVRDLRLEQHVTFVGFLRTPEYLKLLDSVDMLVMPSRQEAGGAVYLEAMALGKPIVGADTGGVSEYVIKERNGILTDLDPDKIADAIISLYRDEERRERMGRDSMVDVMKFDWPKVIDNYIDVYREVTETKRAR